MARFLLSLLLALPAWATEPTKMLTFGTASQAVSTFDQVYLLFPMPRSNSIEVWGHETHTWSHTSDGCYNSRE
jgi:hypothetical protein